MIKKLIYIVINFNCCYGWNVCMKWINKKEEKNRLEISVIPCLCLHSFFYYFTFNLCCRWVLFFLSCCKSLSQKYCRLRLILKLISIITNILVRNSEIRFSSVSVRVSDTLHRDPTCTSYSLSSIMCHSQWK